MIEKFTDIRDYISIIDSLLDPIIIFKKTNKLIKFINYEAENFLEKSRNAVIGDTIDSIFLADSPLQDFIETSMMESGSFIYKDTKIYLNEKNHVLDVEIINNSKFEDLIIVFKNHRKTFEKKNLDNDIYFFDHTLSILGHEIKNPLSSIKVSAQIIQKNYKNIDAELTEIIIDECNRINELINSFQLNVTEVNFKKQKINIHEPLRYTLKKINLKKNQNIKIIEQFDPSLPEVEFDKNNLIMIFENLLNNSIDAIGKKNGYIKIITSFDHQGNKSFPGTSKKHFNNFVHICIEDNGEQIYEKEKIFFPFFSTKKNGKGIGLFLVKKLINHFNGLIFVESDDNKKQFRIYLPI
tara:strand:- start:5703 stop:6761 length:1059 start_codon:yes stop_codon:yes gene_type:complete